LSVVSICWDSDSARLAVTILALCRLASRTRQICQASIPTRAADRQSAKAMVQLSQDERSKAGMVLGEPGAWAVSIVMMRRR